MDPPQGLVEFCRAEWPRLVGSLTLLTGDRGLAEELAQEALVRVCQRWERVATLDSPGGWAHRVAINLARSQVRRRRAAQRAHGRIAPAGGAATEPDVSDQIAVRAAVAALPKRERMAVVLRYYADLTVEDAANVMGCPHNTIKTLTRRAVARLARSGLVDEAELEAEGIGDAH